MVFEELVKEASERNPIVAAYLEGNYQLKHSYKLRPVLSQLLEHSNIKRTNHKPTILTYI